MGLSAIVAVGGAEDKVDKRDILERFVLEAGGKKARIATASEIPDERKVKLAPGGGTSSP